MAESRKSCSVPHPVCLLRVVFPARHELKDIAFGNEHARIEGLLRIERRFLQVCRYGEQIVRGKIISTHYPPPVARFLLHKHIALPIAVHRTGELPAAGPRDRFAVQVRPFPRNGPSTTVKPGTLAFVCTCSLLVMQ
jgi:hypothetical protein